MKNTVTITLDDKKVQALKMYLSEKKTSLDEQLSAYAEQLSAYAEQLYGKIVPQNVRDFIDMTAREQSAIKPKTTHAKPTNQP